MSEEASLGDFKKSSVEDNIVKPRLITGVSWSLIESMPKDWEVKNIGPHISISTGNNFSSQDFAEEGGIPLIRIRDLGSEKTTMDYTGEYDDKYLVQDFDLLVGMDGEFEPHFWFGGQALLNQRVCEIEPDQTYNRIFLRYAIEKPLWYIQKSIAGTTVKHLSQSNIRDVNLPTPPLEEQRKIASVLYNIDLALQKTQELIDQSERLMRGLTQDLLNYGIKDETLIETGSRFGKLPKSWDLYPLREVGEIAGRTAPEKHETECWGGDIPWATPSEITSLEGPTINDTDEHLTEIALDKVSSNLLPAGSVLLTTRATIGKTAVNTVEMTTNQGFKNFVPGQEMDTWYSYYRLNYEGDYLASLSKGSTFPEVGKDTVENFVIPVPPLEEQEEIGRRLKSIDETILSYKSNKSQIQFLKKGLMQDLLSGDVRTTDADIEVLEEVRQHG